MSYQKELDNWQCNSCLQKWDLEEARASSSCPCCGLLHFSEDVKTQFKFPFFWIGSFILLIYMITRLLHA